MTDGVRDEGDPIFLVVGVSAAEIIRRCRAARSGGRSGRRPGRGNRPNELRGYRLVDFADLSNEDFVQAAHRILLGRPAAPSEVERRLGELQHGMSRIQIIVRLALSPEGRVAARPRYDGVGLPLLRVLARGVEAARHGSISGRAARKVEVAMRDALSRRGARP
jgi:hypothetical protein